MQIRQQLCSNRLRQALLLRLAWSKNAFPIGLYCPGMILKLDIESAQELDIQFLFVSVLIAAQQCQQVNIRVSERVENAIRPAADAIDRLALVFALDLNLCLSIGHRVLLEESNFL